MMSSTGLDQQPEFETLPALTLRTGPLHQHSNNTANFNGYCYDFLKPTRHYHTQVRLSTSFCLEITTDMFHGCEASDGEWPLARLRDIHRLHEGLRLNAQSSRRHEVSCSMQSASFYISLGCLRTLFA